MTMNDTLTPELPGAPAVASSAMLGAGRKLRMKPNALEVKTNPYGYHAKEHDEDPTCHAINGRDETACIPVIAPNIALGS